MRSNGRATLSLVAVVDEGNVGHILFYPLTIETGTEGYPALGPGPMAVLPDIQRRDVGFALVRAGLE